MYTSSAAIPVDCGPVGGLPPVLPSAPLIGYESATEKYSEYSAPPPYEEIARVCSSIIPYKYADLSEPEIRNAVKAHVKSKLNYSSSAVSEMNYTGFKNSIAYVYRLTTLHETRKMKSVYSPYDGSYVDSPANGPAPNGWSIYIKSPDSFVDGKSGGIPVPHSEVVQPCFMCRGSARQRCSTCSGAGERSCTSCSGTGARDGVSCSSCHGSKSDRCTWCHGTGSTSCSTCSGRGSLKHWIQIKAHWKVEHDEFVSTTEGVKPKNLIKAQGFLMLDETHPRVRGLERSPFIDDSVVIYSQSVTTKPTTSSRIIRQNQSIKAVPITTVTFTHAKGSGDFYVYGTDNRVHFDNYPSKNCCIS